MHAAACDEIATYAHPCWTPPAGLKPLRPLLRHPATANRAGEEVPNPKHRQDAGAPPPATCGGSRFLRNTEGLPSIGLLRNTSKPRYFLAAVGCLLRRGLRQEVAREIERIGDDRWDHRVRDHR